MIRCDGEITQKLKGLKTEFDCASLPIEVYKSSIYELEALRMGLNIIQRDGPLYILPQEKKSALLP